ncbi:MAG TPA: hypothetical protein VIO16_02230 [Dehalococcoidia bacterium]
MFPMFLVFMVGLALGIGLGWWLGETAAREHDDRWHEPPRRRW